MGGIPVLLMIAAMGITYGWQPDDSGGVVYVIQIPPDQLHELQRIGEISSAIDPAVQGHVSRVIIKVGNSPLPRTTPPNLARQAASPRATDGVKVATDHSPMPIPEMDQRSESMPIANLDSTAGKARSDLASVMKPQTTGTSSGSGFAFPSTSSPLRDGSAAAPNGIRTDVDLAGRPLNTQTSQNPAAAAPPSLSGGLVPPPATRTPNIGTFQQPPSFTGSDPTGALAGPRVGGPSTDPTNTRDNSWQGFPKSSAASTSGISSNPFDKSTANTQGNAPTSQRSASGISTGGTFGKTPSGLTLPSGADQRGAGFAGRNPATSPGTFSQGAYPQSQQAQRNLQSLQATTNRTGSLQSTAINQGQRASTGAQPFAAANTFNTSSNASREQQNAAQTNPNSRLTAAQIAAGAWTLDAYGRPLDRQGRLLTTTTGANQPISSFDSTRGQNQRYSGQTQSSLGQPSTDPRAYANPSAPNYQTQIQPPPSQPAMTQSLPATSSFPQTNQTVRNATLPRAELARREVGATPARADQLAATDRRTTGAAAGGVGTRPQVAAQPLFNGLLLISFVANVYLIFWLKNLRLQFHDLVAAKRITKSSSAPT